MSAELFSGSWDYNAALSVDAATGRPEQAPRSAAQRPASADTAAAPTSTVRSPGQASRNPGGDAQRAMVALMVAERRVLVRDLLEVPERLTIRASDAEVTFTDDLDRARTFAADGKMQKYQLGGAKFEARARWHETYFRKDIEGPNGFKMSETYFLGEDGSRMYVIVRIGDPSKPETLAGINRVYDRINPRP
jgi:hypothetical protein